MTVMILKIIFMILLLNLKLVLNKPISNVSILNDQYQG